MKIFGANVGQIDFQGRSSAHPLADGGAALLVDGAVACAAIEERLQRRRYAGGFRRAAAACLAAPAATGDPDAYALSSCCGSVWSREDALEHLRAELGAAGIARSSLPQDPSSVLVVDHHLSHAMLAFATLPIAPDPVLVCVLDGMGNRLGALRPGDAWWQGAFERQSYYLGRWVAGRVRLEKVHEEAAGDDEVGLGEMYRAVTHWLGWHSYQHAGKTMALAAFGDPERFAPAEFARVEPESGITVPMQNHHDRPLTQVAQVLRRAGLVLPAIDAGTAGPGHQTAVDLAARAQHQLEQALARVVPWLAERLGVRRVALGGGVALNCVALGALHQAAPRLELHVPCAPSDTGQALGNALYAAYAEDSPFAEASAPRDLLNRCDFGPRYGATDMRLALSDFEREHGRRFTTTRVDDPRARACAAVDALCDGCVIAVRQGGSEYGPRALGHSSVLADPRSAEMHARVNSHKRREPFRPYAPSILAEHASAWFDAALPSPFMSFAGRWTAGAARRVPAVVHVDGSARYHTVAPGAGFYRSLIEEFMRRTSVPVLLNTSFNANGEPIVESPADALASFVAMDLDALVLEDWLVVRNP